MKLQLDTNHLLVSGKFAESDFSVGDPRIIIHHLVKSVYSNPKLTMVQEIACNARDSHTENGNENVPIRIKVPTTFSPDLEIRDFGPGIDPSRMHDIFIKIGNSTKRENNDTDGSFGIGAKIPLSYTDQFTIRTICKENGHLTLRVYVCVRRDDFSLKLMEVGDPHIINNTDPTDDQRTGTTIIIPIKPEDMNSIRDAVITKTEFWKVRPELSGATPEELAYPTRKWFLQTDDFSFTMNNDSYDSSLTAVVNGVVYPVAYDRYRHNDNAPKFDFQNFGGKIFLNFAIGEIKPALSRENLHYDEKTVAIINKRTKEAIAHIKSKIQSIIDLEPTLLDAYNACNKFSSNNWMSRNEDFKWRKHKIPHVIETSYKMVKDTYGNDKKEFNDTLNFTRFNFRDNKVKYRNQNNIELGSLLHMRDEKTPIFFSTKATPCWDAVRYYLHNNNVSRNSALMVLVAPDRATVEKWFTDRQLGELNTLLLDIKDTGYVRPTRGRNGTSGTKIITRWNCNRNDTVVSNGIFDPKDTKGGYFYVVDKSKGNEITIPGIKGTFRSDELYKFIQVCGIDDAHGISPGNVKFLNNKIWKSLGTLFDNNGDAAVMKKLNDWNIYLARKNYGENLNAFCLGSIKGIDVSVLSNKSLFRMWVEKVKALPANRCPTTNQHWSFEHMAEQAVEFAKRFVAVKTFDHNEMQTAYDAVIQKYPMIKHIRVDGGNFHKSLCADIIDYIKMVEKA